MKLWRSHKLASLAVFLLLAGPLFAQQEPESESSDSPSIILLSVKARIEDGARVVHWQKDMEQVTISGKPVSFKLDGQGLRVRALFTPYQGRPRQYVLVAQAQVFLNEGDSQNAHSSFQTLTCWEGETVLFYPLGKVQNNQDPSVRTLVMELVLTPFQDTAEPVGQVP